MRTYARIDEGAVQELFSTDGDMVEMFHPALKWVDVTDDNPAPLVGWLYDGEHFTEPQPPVAA